MNEHIICFKRTVTNYYVLDCYENDFIINGKLYIFYVKMSIQAQILLYDS